MNSAFFTTRCIISNNTLSKFQFTRPQYMLTYEYFNFRLSIKLQMGCILKYVLFCGRNPHDLARCQNKLRVDWCQTGHFGHCCKA